MVRGRIAAEAAMNEHGGASLSRSEESLCETRTSEDGDARLEQLYVEYADLVWRALARHGVPQASIDDALQDVFLVAHQKLGDYREEGKRGAWLVAISRRVAADRRRAAMRRAAREDAAASRAPTAVDPEQELLRRDAAAFMEPFLASLEPDRREVFVLADIEGMSAPEIAKALGIKLNTVYSRLRRARLAFQSAIERRNEEQR
jgi:RNA polymerase sigma-70 factor, ECF subfamily